LTVHDQGDNGLASKTKSTLFTPVLIAGSLILMTGFSIRASFGVFQIPIAEEFDWLRIEFSLAIAIQNRHAASDLGIA